MAKVKTTKKDRQYNGQSKKDKGTNNHLQNITQKTMSNTNPTKNQGMNLGALEE
jgi:hypothetical protein